MNRRLGGSMVLGLLVQATWADSLTVIGFNVEGKQPSTPPTWDSTIETVAATVQAAPKADLWGFSEVPGRDWAGKLKAALGESYWYLWGDSGEPDHLTIIYNKDTLELIGEAEELSNPAYTGRKPLVAQFKLKSNGSKFRFMVNHLTRGNENNRHAQAKALHDWAQHDVGPVIAVGDYNFDLDLHKRGDKWYLTGALDLGLYNLTKDGVWTWIQPETLTPTQCGGAGSQYTSILDFVFVNRDALDWAQESRILDLGQPCPDDEKHSDHRAVLGRFEIP